MKVSRQHSDQMEFLTPPLLFNEKDLSAPPAYAGILAFHKYWGKKPYEPLAYPAPALEWTRSIRNRAGHCDADRMIGKLAGGRLLNPHVLIRPFIQREAVLSSKIEVAQAMLGELLAAETVKRRNIFRAFLKIMCTI